MSFDFGFEFGTGARSIYAPTDNTAPNRVAVATNAAGTQIAITCDEGMDPTSVPASSAFALGGTTAAVSTVAVSGLVITLDLSGTIYVGDTVTLGYTQPSSGKIRDLAGNNLASFSGVTVDNLSTATPGDVTAPTLTSAVLAASGLTLTLTYDEALDAASVPADTSFTLGGVGGIQVVGVQVTGSTVVLTLEAEVLQVSTVMVSYAVPTTGKVQDAAGNAAAALTNQAVTNNSTFFDAIFSLANGVFAWEGTKSEVAATSAGVSDPGDVSKAGWTRTQLTPISATAMTVDASATTPKIAQNLNNPGAGNPCIPVLYVFKIKTTGFDWVRVNTRAGTVTAANCLWINYTAGTAGTTGANLTNLTIGAQDGNGFRTCYFLCEINGGVPMIEFAPCTADNSTTAPSAGSTLEIKEDATNPGWVYQPRLVTWYDRVQGAPLTVDPLVTSGMADVQPGYGTVPLVDKISIGGVPALRTVGGQRLTGTDAAVLAMMTGSGMTWTVAYRCQPDFDDADATMFGWGQQSTTNGNLKFGFGNGGTGRHRAFFTTDAGVTSEYEATADMANDRASKVIVWRWDGTTLSCRENGVAVTLSLVAGSTGSYTSSSSFTPDHYGWGATPASGSPDKINGRCSAVLGWSRALSNTECSQVEAEI